VPASAIIDDGVRQVVLIALDEGRFKPQPVRIGQRGTEYVEITEGIAAGDRVVVSANFLIDSESQLKAALSNLTDAGSAAGDAAGATIYEAEGTFDAHDPATQTVTLTHGDVPALQWPAMTMDFGLASNDVVAGLAPGAKVRFEFRAGEPGEFVVTRIERATGAAGHGGH